MTAKGSDVFRGCAAFEGGDNCNVCKHHYSSHVHWRTLWKKVEEEYDCIDDYIASTIEKLSNGMFDKQNAVNDAKIKIEQLEQDIQNTRSKIQNLMNNMKQICSDFNYEKEIDLSISILKERREHVQSGNQLDTQAAQLSLIIDMFISLKNLIFENTIKK